MKEILLQKKITKKVSFSKLEDSIMYTHHNDDYDRKAVTSYEDFLKVVWKNYGFLAYNRALYNLMVFMNNYKIREMEIHPKSDQFTFLYPI